MTQYVEPQSTVSTPEYTGTSYARASAWVGWIAFAGIIMSMLGTFHIIEGFVALFNDQYFLVPKSGLIVNVDYTAWGWVQIVWGIVVVAAGVGVFTGRVWARVVGTLVALASALINIGFLGAYPILAVTMIALDVVVILALTVHGSDVKLES